MRRLIIGFITAVMLGVSLGLVAAVPAAAPAAAHSQWTCAHGAGCLFLDINGGPAGGSHLTFYFSVWVTPEDPPGTCHNLPTTWYNAASSVVSDYGSGYDLVLFENENCSDLGDKIVSPRNLNFTGWWAFLNDDVQSFKIAQ